MTRSIVYFRSDDMVRGVATSRHETQWLRTRRDGRVAAAGSGPGWVAQFAAATWVVRSRHLHHELFKNLQAAVETSLKRC